MCVCEICEECVQVKREHTEVCMSMRVQVMKSTQEKNRVHNNFQSVHSLKVRTNELEKKRTENEGRKTLKLKKNVHQLIYKK